jgi:hypothetical protein
MGLLFPKEELMRWKEPSNYQQEKSSLTLNAALFLIGFNVIAIVVLWFTSLEEGKKAGFIIFAIFVGFFMTNITVGYYFGTSTVTLEEDGVGQRQGKYRGFQHTMTSKPARSLVKNFRARVFSIWISHLRIKRHLPSANQLTTFCSKTMLI